MSKIIGVDASSITGISGLRTSGSSSIQDFAMPQANSGILMWGGVPRAPESIDFDYNGYDTVVGLYPTKAKISSHDVVRWDFNTYGGAYLTSTGDLYTCWTSATNQSMIGRAVTASAPADEYHLAATGVSKFAVSQYGFAYISTSGTYHYSGPNYYWGASTTSTPYAFNQVGTDTDWIDIICDPSSGFSQTVKIAIKGANGGKLYVIGSNAEGKTGQNTTSGSVSYFTLMSDGAGGTFNVEGWTDVQVTSDSPGAIDSTGRLYRWGEGNYGAAGVGTNTDILYPTQVGTDTDWEKLGPMRNVQMAIKGGELWYCSAANYGDPFTYAFSKTYDKTWRQATNSGGLWEEIITNDSEVQNSCWVAKYNGSWYISSVAPYIYGNFNGPNQNDIYNSSGTDIANTTFKPISSLETYPTGATIDWVRPYAAGNLNSAGFLLIKAS